MKRIAAAALVLASLLAVASVASADTDKVLTRVKGTVSVQRDGTAPFRTIAGSLGVRDESIARTGKKSAAVIALVDSSEIDLGETTQVRIGAFDRNADVATHTIAIDGGALKFTIRHPVGGRSNYRFVTPTSQIGIRGTTGILIVTPSKTTVICLDCGADDLVVTHDGTDEALASGQVLQLIGLPGSQSVVRVPLKGFVDPALEQFLGDTYRTAMAKAMPAIKAAMKRKATPDPCATNASGNRVSSETASETFDTIGTTPGCK